MNYAGPDLSMVGEPTIGDEGDTSFAVGVLVLLCHKLRRERPFVFAPQHGQRDKMATSLAMSRRRRVGIELGT